MKLTQARDAYITARISNGFADGTVKNDRIALDRLLRAVGDIECKTLTPMHIDTLMASETARGLSRGSLNLTQANLSSFFKWCRARGVLKPDQDPIAGRRYLPQEPAPRLRISIEDFTHLLDSATLPRDRMLIACGLYLMARQSEITNIQFKHINLDAGEITVYVKKSKLWDTMPITSELRTELVRWMNVLQDECGPIQPDWYLVPPRRKRGFHESTYEPTARLTRPHAIVHDVLTAAGINDGGDNWVGLHVLRRSAARAAFDEMAKDGYDGALRRISAWLHHKNTATSEIYLSLDLDKATRNRDYNNKPLYPSLQATNVVPLRREA